MPIPTAGVTKVELVQTYLGQECINTFYYWDQSNTEPVSFVPLAADFDTKVVTTLSGLQHVGVVYDAIRLSTVFGTLPDYSVTTTAGGGIVVGAEMASWIAFQYRLFGTTKETRSGYKRFAGMVEINADGNNVTGAFQVAMDALVPQLLLPLVAGPSHVPIILRRPNGTTILNYFANPLLNAISQLKLSHQHSRDP